MRISGSLGLNNFLKFGVVKNGKPTFALSHLHVEFSAIDEILDSKCYLAFKDKENGSYKLTNSSLTEEFVSFLDLKKWLTKNSEQIELAVFYNDNTPELFLFRNIFGIVPLYYIHLPGNQFHFSTHLSSLLEIKEVRNHISINYNWVENYLNFAGDSAYSTETIYSQIKLLYPGHYLHISKDVFKEELLINFDTARYDQLQTLGEFGEEFRYLFSKSVHRHLSPGKTIGAELSGGLDSSSVCAMSRHLFPDHPIHTFYLNVPGVVIDESHFAADAAAEMKTVHHVLRPDTDVLNLIISHTTLSCYPDQSISGPSVFAPQLKLARDLGIKTMLSGHDGDGIVGLGIEYPQMLYKNRQFALLKDTFTNRANNYSFADRYPNWDKFSPTKKKRVYSRDFLINQALLKLDTKTSISWLNLLADSMKILGPFAGISEIVIKGAYKFLRKTTREDVFMSDHIFRSEFYESYHGHKTPDDNIIERLSHNLTIRDPYAIPDIFSGPSLTVPEDFYALKDHYGVTAKFPFLDKSLFELCIATPQSIKFDNGRLRGHMREGMRGILPEKIRTRVSKSRFGNYSKIAALELYQQAREILNESHEIWSIIDKKKFDRLAQVYLKSNTAYSRANFLLIRTISLAVWFDIFKTRQKIIS